VSAPGQPAGREPPPHAPSPTGRLSQVAVNECGEDVMKALNIVTLILVIIGGLNWGLVGLLNLDLVAAIFGAGSVLSRLIYILVGLSALWQLVPLFKQFSKE
jgi:uncharacterized membrane protein YuzA (DUF378 family)